VSRGTPRQGVALAVALTALVVGASALAAASVSVAAAPRLTDWPEFGLNPQRTNATDQSTGITAANVRRLRLRTVALPGTADNSAVYVHGVRVNGADHDVAIVTTTYGITLAIDADDERRQGDRQRNDSARRPARHGQSLELHRDAVGATVSEIVLSLTEPTIGTWTCAPAPGASDGMMPRPAPTTRPPRSATA